MLSCPYINIDSYHRSCLCSHKEENLGVMHRHRFSRTICMFKTQVFWAESRWCLWVLWRRLLCCLGDALLSHDTLVSLSVPMCRSRHWYHGGSCQHGVCVHHPFHLWALCVPGDFPTQRRPQLQFTFLHVITWQVSVSPTGVLASTGQGLCLLCFPA